MLRNNTVIILVLCIWGSSGLFSCSSDEEISQTPPSEEYISKAKEVLSGEIVLSTKATMNGVDKTLLPTGCPTKFSFAWKEEEPSPTVAIALKGFTVGKMPLVVYFYINAKFMQLNTWDKDEYTGNGWVKFSASDGVVTASENKDGTTTESNGSSITGYLNVLTKQIIFVIDYNLMNVRSECFLQTIDKTRTDRFDEEWAQYEKDLEAYKEEHGLS